VLINKLFSFSIYSFVFISVVSLNVFILVSNSDKFEIILDTSSLIEPYSSVTFIDNVDSVVEMFCGSTFNINCCSSSIFVFSYSLFVDSFLVEVFVLSISTHKLLNKFVLYIALSLLSFKKLQYVICLV
jgi:hypothetical protein